MLKDYIFPKEYFKFKIIQQAICSMLEGGCCECVSSLTVVSFECVEMCASAALVFLSVGHTCES